MERSTKILLVVGGSALALGILAVAFRKKAVAFLLEAHHEKHIKQLHPTVQDTFRRFIDAIEKKGWKVLVTSSYRSWADQERLNKEGYEYAVSTGGSPHNYGFALDINLQKGVKLVRMASTNKEWEETGAPAIARMLGIRWGGSFTGTHKGDLVHFDLLPLPVSELKKLAVAQFGSNPANIQGNSVRLT